MHDSFVLPSLDGYWIWNLTDNNGTPGISESMIDEYACCFRLLWYHPESWMNYGGTTCEHLVSFEVDHGYLCILLIAQTDDWSNDMTGIHGNNLSTIDRYNRCLWPALFGHLVNTWAQHGHNISIKASQPTVRRWSTCVRLVAQHRPKAASRWPLHIVFQLSTCVCPSIILQYKNWQRAPNDMTVSQDILVEHDSLFFVSCSTNGQRMSNCHE